MRWSGLCGGIEPAAGSVMYVCCCPLLVFAQCEVARRLFLISARRFVCKDTDALSVSFFVRKNGYTGTAAKSGRRCWYAKNDSRG